MVNSGISHSQPPVPCDSEEPMAIIGLACHLPGGVASPSDFWTLLENERSGHCKVPNTAFNIDAFYHPDQKRPGSVFTKGGYFLQEDTRDFDPAFFGINAAEASDVDPQQRKLLESVFECLESAGVPMERIAGSKTACYVANFTTDITQLNAYDYEFASQYKAVGASNTILSNRINYCFDLKGPSFTVDTACSSALYALHLACNSLKLRECDAAIVSGTNLIFNIDYHLFAAKMGVLSPTSICHTFDEAADGYGRGEAVSSLMVKRLSDALKDGDTIRAVIRSTSVNSNGRGAGISHPSKELQAAVIRDAYERAKLSPRDTSYFECHGTGTPVGDPVEVAAIGSVFGPLREDPLLIGAVKPNIGHTEAASAISSIIKVILSFEHDRIPATIGVNKLNPRIDFDGTKTRVVTKATPWPQGFASRRASVNSFGFGGANAHCILEAAPCSFVKQKPFDPLDFQEGISKIPPTVLVLSAHSEQALKYRIADTHEYLLNGQYSTLDLSYTLATRRSRLFYGAYVVGTAEKLRRDGLDPRMMSFQNKQTQLPKATFVFTGQGAQWAGMGKQLIQTYLSVRHSISQLDRVLSSLDAHLRPSWTIEETLISDGDVHKASKSQPLCTAVQIAVVDLLASWNIRPAITVGHSSGEIAAAYSAGLISRAEAITLAYLRGLAVERVNKSGAMLAVGVGEFEGETLLNEFDCHQSITIACVNSPKSITLSGDVSAVESLRDNLNSKSIFCRLLKTDGRAYHSAHMHDVGPWYEQTATSSLEKFSDELRQPENPPAPMISSVNTDFMTRKSLPISYWRRNLESPVLFDHAIGLMLNFPILGSDKRISHFIEIGPHAALSSPLKQTIEEYTTRNPGKPLVYLPSLKRGEDAAFNLVDLAARLHLIGFPVDMERVTSLERREAGPDIIYQTGSLLTDLPRYRWVYNDMYWNEAIASREKRLRRYPRHDLLGTRVPGSPDSAPVWTNTLRVEDLPWLADHRIDENNTFPATAYVAMALEAIRQVMESKDAEAAGFKFQNVAFSSALLIPENTGIAVQLSLTPAILSARKSSSSTYEFVITSFNGEVWVSNCRGTVSAEQTMSPIALEPTKHSDFRQPIKTKFFYDLFSASGLSYGRTFQNLRDLECIPHRCYANATLLLRPTDQDYPHESRYILHPGTMDACLQLTSYAAQRGTTSAAIDGYLPVLAGTVLIWNKTASNSSAWVEGSGNPRGLNAVYAEGSVWDDNGEPVMQYTDVQYKRTLSMSRDEDGERAPFFRLIWKPDVSRVDDQKLAKILEFDDATLEESHSESDWVQTPSCEEALCKRVLRTVSLLCHNSPAMAVGYVLDGSVTHVRELLHELNVHSSYAHYERFTILVQNREATGLDEHLSNMVRVEIKHLDQTNADEFSAKFDLLVAPKEMSYDELRTFLKQGGKLVHGTSAKRSADEMLSGDTEQKIVPVFKKLRLPAVNQVVEDELGTMIITTTPNSSEPPPVNGHATRKVCNLIYRHNTTSVVDQLANIAFHNGWEVQRTRLHDTEIDEDALNVLLADLEGPLLADLAEGELQALQRLCFKGSRMLWVTNAGTIEGRDPLAAMTTGLVNSIANEVPSLHLLTLDVYDAHAPTTAASIFSIFSDFEKPFTASNEQHFVEDNGIVHIGRVLEDNLANQHFRERTTKQVPSRTTFLSKQPIKASVAQAGVLDTMFFTDDHEQANPLGAQDVEVEVKATGLNNKDVTTIMGIFDHPAATFSHEYSGIVRRVGPAVLRVAPGDRCVLMCGGRFNTFIRCQERNIVKVPDGNKDSFEELATLPIVYQTAIYALNDVAKIQEAETLLIHTAGGGAGIAAIRMGQLLKAEIFATVGSEEKRKFLIEELHIPSDHIFNSRDSKFVQGIMAATGGVGVDVAINTLTNELFHATWNCMAPFGRFIEIGKKDIIDRGRLDMSVFDRNVSFTAFDLGDVMENPRRGDKISAEFEQLLAEGKLLPIKPLTTFSVEQLQGAIQRFVSKNHIGKIVITYPEAGYNLKYQPSVPVLKLRSDATYLMVGCLGGLGRNLSQWMVERGARSFLYLARTPLDRNKEGHMLVQFLRRAGISVTVVQGDVAIREDVERAIRSATTPIAGVIHAAFVENDCSFDNMTVPLLHASTAPKITGALNLHSSLLSAKLDFFVLMSSVSSVAGAPRQSNYNAGNAALDALARHRRHLGLPGVSVGLGLILDFGYVAEASQGKFLNIGSAVISESEFHQILEEAMTTRPEHERHEHYDAYTSAHLVTGLEAKKLIEAVDAPGQQSTRDGGFFWQSNPRFSAINAAVARERKGVEPGEISLKAKLRLLAEKNRTRAIQEAAESITNWLANLLGLAPAEIDKSKPMADYGMVSMTSGELRIWLFKTLGVKISLLETINSASSIEQLGEIALDKLLEN